MSSRPRSATPSPRASLWLPASLSDPLITTRLPDPTVWRSGTSTDVKIAAIAACQAGAVARVQLLAAGITSAEIRRRLPSGTLHLLRPGVYAVGHPALSAIGEAWGSVLACRRTAMSSHRAAARLWGFGKDSWAVTEVTTLASSGVRSRHTPLVHRTRSLSVADLRWLDGLPISSPARTIVDCADVLSVDALRRVLNQALVKKRLRPDEVEGLLTTARGRRGLRRLRQVLGAHVGPTRSGTEDVAVAHLVAAGLPRPEVNATVEDIECDLLFRGHRLVVELDGGDFHRTPFDAEDDRDQELRLRRAGIDTIRFTATQVERSPMAFVASVSAELARRRPGRTDPPHARAA